MAVSIDRQYIKMQWLCSLPLFYALPMLVSLQARDTVLRHTFQRSVSPVGLTTAEQGSPKECLTATLDTRDKGRPCLYREPRLRS